MDISEYIKKMQTLENDLDDYYQQFLLNESVKVLNIAKLRTPVDTGTLRASWEIGKYNNSDKSITIRNPTQYASFIEYGTRNIKPFNMITGALNELNFKINEKFNTSFNKFLKEKGLK